MSSQDGLVQRLWNYCNVLRDDGLSYGDYIEQLTYLLFLKMADEQTKPPFSAEPFIPEGLDWPSLLARDGDGLEVHYRHLLTELGRRPGMLGVVFRKAQNRIQDPAKLRRLIVDLIDRETWLTLDVDVKGDAYEGLLEKNAEDVKSGAGQYFTPRPLIRALVEVMRPEPGMTICDPACGTGGFLLAAHEWISRNYPYLDPDEKRHLRFEALDGWEIVDNTARLCVMNLLLHGIGSEETESPIRVDDALKADPGDRFEMVLTNPPFGKKSSMTVVWTSHSWRSLRRTVSPAPPSKRTLSGTTIADRPPGLSSVLTCWRKLSCLFDVDAQKSSRTITSCSRSLSPSAFTPVPEVIAQEIVEDLEAALSEFAAIAESLRSEP